MSTTKPKADRIPVGIPRRAYLLLRSLAKRENRSLSKQMVQLIEDAAASLHGKRSHNSG